MMPSARVLLWAGVAFLVLGAVAFAAVAGALLRPSWLGFAGFVRAGWRQAKGRRLDKEEIWKRQKEETVHVLRDGVLPAAAPFFARRAREIAKF